MLNASNWAASQFGFVQLKFFSISMPPTEICPNFNVSNWKEFQFWVLPTGKCANQKASQIVWVQLKASQFSNSIQTVIPIFCFQPKSVLIKFSTNWITSNLLCFQLVCVLIKFAINWRSPIFDAFNWKKFSNFATSNWKGFSTWIPPSEKF